MTDTDPKRAAYSAATAKLRDMHRTDFNDLLKVEMSERGVEWAPRPTEEQKAEQQVAELLAKYPDLKVKFTDPQD